MIRIKTGKQPRKGGAGRSYGVICIAFLITYACCVLPVQGQTAPVFRKSIQEWVAILREDPNNVEALRELGVRLVYAQEYRRAKALLLRAMRLAPRDTKTIFYYGICLEFTGSPRKALALYQTYNQLTPSPFRNQMEGRYYHLKKDLAREDVRLLLDQTQLQVDTIRAANTIAVFPIIYLGSNDQHEIYEAAFTDLIVSDLRKIKGIEVVDPVRIQTLMEEMSATSLDLKRNDVLYKLGSILGAGWVICGAFDSAADNILNMNIYIRDILHKKPPNRFSAADFHYNIVDYEKKIILEIIKIIKGRIDPQLEMAIQANRPHDLETFRLYSRAVRYETQGNWEYAARDFDRVYQLDSRFPLARERANKNYLMAATSVEALGVMKKMEFSQTFHVPNPDLNQLIQNRLEIMAGQLGAVFVPGTNSRKGAADAAGSGINPGLVELPPPPQPPE